MAKEQDKQPMRGEGEDKPEDRSRRSMIEKETEIAHIEAELKKKKALLHEEKRGNFSSGGEGGRFRLKAGRCVLPDLNQPVNEETGKHPTKVVNIGEVVEFDKDLVALEGPERWEKVGEMRGSIRDRGRGTGNVTPGDPTPENVKKNPSVAPHGQVQTGRQQARTQSNATTPSSAPLSSPLDPELHDEAEKQSMENVEQQQNDAGNEISQEGAETSDGGEGEDDGLDALTINDLHRLAADEEIEVTRSMKKPDLVNAIRTGRQSK